MLNLRSASVCLMPGLLSLSLMSVAQPVISTQTPKVVFDSGRTVDATRYYSRQRFSSESPKNKPTLPSAPAQLALSLDLADRLPLTPQRLKPGTLRVLEVNGLVTPFFVIGMDDQSLEWFSDASDTLSAMHATGLVVEVSDRKAWFALQAHAAQRGIRLSLLNGDALATAYGFATYPTVFMPEDPTL